MVHNTEVACVKESPMRRPVSVFALGVALVVALPAGQARASSGKSVTLNGYLEFRKGTYLIIDGQRVLPDGDTKFSGNDRATNIEKTPIGYEMKVKGTREKDGTVHAKSIEASPNHTGSAEKQILSSTDAAEAAYVKAGKVYEQGKD